MNYLGRIILRTMSTRQIELLYDVASPFSWLAFEVMHRYEKHWKVNIDWVPVLVAGIFKAANNLAPMMGSSVPKLMYLQDDLLRQAAYFDVPIQPMQPENMGEFLTKGSVQPMRFLIAIKMLYPQYLHSASRAFWHKRWNKHEDFTNEAALEEAGLNAGMTKEEIKKVLEKALSPEVKEKLRTNTDYAIEYGAFGVPTTVVNINGSKKIYFGADRFELIAHEIGEEWKGPYPDLSSKL